MADTQVAISYVLTWEDATLSGKITVDPGGRTRFGIAEKFHPELAASLFYSSLGSQAALQIARGIYERQYCEPLCIAQIADQNVANKLLSLGVNIGILPASRMLQDAVMALVDGNIGPLTLMKLSESDPVVVLNQLRAQAEAYYRNLVAENPSDAVYLDGWLRRAAA